MVTDNSNNSGNNTPSKSIANFLTNGIAKKLTLFILFAAFVMGNIGSWFTAFDMSKYVVFINAFTPMYLGLIVSIGGNSAVEKLKGKNNDRN